MEYIPKKRAKKATRAIYIKEDTITNIEKMAVEEKMTFSELVNDMIDFCFENKVAVKKKPKGKNYK